MLALILFIIALSSCSDISDLKKEVAVLKHRVDQLEHYCIEAGQE